MKPTSRRHNIGIVYDVSVKIRQDGILETWQRYCQMLWMRFFSAQPRSRIAGCFDLFISPASKARFGKALTPGLPAYLASAGG